MGELERENGRWKLELLEGKASRWKGGLEDVDKVVIGEGEGEGKRESSRGYGNSLLY